MSFKNPAATDLLNSMLGKSSKPTSKKPSGVPVIPKGAKIKPTGTKVKFSDLDFEERNARRLGNYNQLEVLHSVPLGTNNVWFIQVARVQWGEGKEVIDIRKLKIVDGELETIGKGISMSPEEFELLREGIIDLPHSD